MLTWKDVLNPNHNWHGTIDNFFDSVVVASGYPYFLWSGTVYQVENDTYFKTEFTDGDID